jgi:hypothetical protein
VRRKAAQVDNLIWQKRSEVFFEKASFSERKEAFQSGLQTILAVCLKKQTARV